MTTITLQDKVLLHLYQFKHLRLDDSRYGPLDLTQDGIASALNISRPHVSQVLTEMVSKGDIEIVNCYVIGASKPVKRKMYRLSMSGRLKYDRVRQELVEMGVDVDCLGINFNNCDTDRFRNLQTEDRNLLGCLSVLRIEVRRNDLHKNVPLVVFNHNGILSLNGDAKNRYVRTGSPEEVRDWHSMAADWVLDHGNDVQERLYHLNNAGRDIECIKLIKKSRHLLFGRDIRESAKIVNEIGKRCRDQDIMKIGTLLSLESGDPDSAEKMISDITADDPQLGGALKAELYLNIGQPKKALSIAQDCYRGDIDTGIALGKSLLANEKYPEAKDCLMWVKHEMISKGDLFRMDDVLYCQAETEWNLDDCDGAQRTIMTAKSLTSNPRILEKLDSLSRSIESVSDCSEDRVLLEGVDV